MRFNSGHAAYFERIEPIFNELKAISGSTKLYCDSIQPAGWTVACVP